MSEAERMTDELTQTYLLGAFALGLVLTCRCLVQLVFGSDRSRSWVQPVFSTAAIAAAAILAADAIRNLDQSNASLTPVFGLPICGLALLSFPLHSQVAALRLPARELISRPAAWLMLAWCASITGWSAFRFYDAGLPNAEELTSQPHPELVEEQHAAAVSDRGRTIPLFHMQSTAPHWPGGYQAPTPALKRMAQTVIRLHGPDSSSNCHGWIFAGGKYLVDGRGAQTILDDNGYEPCKDPRPGDLIVYWTGRFVAHTGLVSSVLADGTVLIESKWNMHERFLHRPSDQPYSREFTFYRTSRGSHKITIRDSRQPAR